MNTILTITTKSTSSFERSFTVRIRKACSGQHFIIAQKNNRPPFFQNELLRTKRMIDVKVVDDIFSRLKEIQIPAVPDFEMGCDGGFTELCVGDYSGKAHYRWWSVPPMGWEKLDIIAKEIIDLSDMGRLE